MIEFLTIWVFMRPRISVRKSSWRSLQRMPPRATLPPRRWMPSRQPRVDVDLEHGPRRGHALDLAAVDLDREHRPLRPLVEVRAQRRAQQVVEGAQHLVLGEAAHRLERACEAGVGLGHRRRPVAGRGGVEARGERA